MQLEESSTNSSKTEQLEKEVKEKNLLIGKLRHEGTLTLYYDQTTLELMHGVAGSAVIMNEHLMEALRRLRRSSTDTNVDRRLVTNVLLSFLTTPRADSKRFEMLSLLSSILQWNDDEREKAGLQRKGGILGSTAASLWGRATGKGSAPELEKTDETEVSHELAYNFYFACSHIYSQSFSRLWVEFLLTEAASGDGSTPTSPKSPARGNNSMPPTPTHSAHSPTYLSPGSQRPGRRLPSFTSTAMASSPNLNLVLDPPSRKGKERATDRNSTDS